MNNKSPEKESPIVYIFSGKSEDIHEDREKISRVFLKNLSAGKAASNENTGLGSTH